jgi:integrase
MLKDEITFKAIADQYLCQSAMKHSPQLHRGVNWLVQHDLLPQWGEKSVTDIRRVDGIKLVTTIAARAPHKAAKVATVIGAIFNLALDNGALEANPMSGLSRCIPKKPAKLEYRILTPSEIEKIWKAIAEVSGHEACKRAIKLILVTGQTPGAVAGMHRREINGDSWTIPAERCRGGRRPHRVYLSPLALDLIGNHDGYIFGSADGTRHVEVNALRRLSRRVNNLPHYGLDSWTVMDLRRTVVHHMAMSGISGETLTAIFGKPQHNPILPALSFDADAKVALLNWSTELLRLLKAA